jgi:hypothetical protein
MRRTAVWCLATVAVTVLGPADRVAAEPATLVVDDDRQQCAQAQFTSIQEAVTAAHAGDLIRVCAGRYVEAVSVDKPLTLKAETEAIEAIDCFAATLPEVTAVEYAIIEPSDVTAPAFTLAADGVDVSGFVVRDRTLGMSTSGYYSGYRIHHNLFTNNTLAIHLASGANVESRQQSRFHHNCLRENTWGLSDEFDVLIDVRIDHNATFKTVERAFEAIGLVVDVTFDHNVSQLDDNTYLLSGTKDSRIIDNTLDRVRIGMEIGRLMPNVDLEISGNILSHIRESSSAIGFNPPANGEPNRAVVVSGNTITGYGTGLAIGVATRVVEGVRVAWGSLADSETVNSEIVGNTITNSVQNAIRLRALNTGITVRDNILNTNGRHGIHAECGLIAGTTERICPTDNTFIANEMLGNGYAGPGFYDARDDTGFDASGAPRELQNTWIANRCDTDYPNGKICGLG